MVCDRLIDRHPGRNEWRLHRYFILVFVGKRVARNPLIRDESGILTWSSLFSPELHTQITCLAQSYSLEFVIPRNRLHITLSPQPYDAPGEPDTQQKREH